MMIILVSRQVENSGNFKLDAKAPRAKETNAMRFPEIIKKQHEGERKGKQLN